MHDNKSEASSLGGKDIKRFESGSNEFRILSNLYTTQSHYIAEHKTSVLCKGDECYFCKQYKTVLDKEGKPKEELIYRKSTDRYYYAILNKEECILSIPFTVFEFMQIREVEKGLDKRTRNFSVVKKGSGLDTTYATNDDGEADTKITDAELEVNNAKLESAISRLEEYMTTQYGKIVGGKSETPIEDISLDEIEGF